MFPGLLHGRGSSRASQFWMGLRSFLRTLVFGPLVSAVLCVGQQGKNLEVHLTASAQKPELVVQMGHSDECATRKRADIH
jgi:hypothetical protein